MIKLVVAGPGTGKTTFITAEIRKLLEKGTGPERILALTFTEKAAEEMLGRLDEAMPLGYEPPWVSTFHGFCDRILRERGIEIGLDPAYKIISPAQAWLLLRQNLYDLPLNYYRPLGNPTKFLSALLELFSRAKDEEVSPEEYLAWAEKRGRKARGRGEKEEAKRQIELAKVYTAYQKILLKDSYLDFGDLIAWTIKLFKDRPSVLADYRRQFKHIYVDEFQDTNFAQFSLINLLVPSKADGRSAGRTSNLTVVGDDDQAIYKWRGASVSNILEFKKRYPRAQTKVLNTSYRLTDRLAQASHRMIKNNNPFRLEEKFPKISKKLKTKRTGKSPDLLYARSAEGEAEAILRKIVEMVSSEGKSFSDFAILARANAHLEPFIAAFKRHELPFQIVGNRGLFEQEEVASLLAVLRVISDPQDYASWYRVLNIPAFKLPVQDVLAFIAEAKKEHVPTEDVLAKRAPRVLAVIQKVAEESRRISPSHLLFDFVQESGYVEEFVKAPTVENQLKIENISLFFQRIHQYEGEVRSPNIPELVDYLDMLMEAGESPAQAVVEDVDTVSLMTVHAAKGLEFPVVFLVSLTADRFPTRRRGGAIELPEEFIKELKTSDWKGMDPEKAERLGHMQEERRLFYVGVTRSSGRVFLSFAQNYGGVRDKRPSPFIHELGAEVPAEPDNLLLLRPPRTEEIRELADREIDVKSLVPAKFSYSQLEDYRTCPWKYRYKYIFKIPAAPTPPLSFGISMHETLREFELRLMHGEKPTLKDLLEIYREHFLSQGYRDKKEKEEYLKQGRKMLTAFYKEGIGKLADPFMVEKSFEVKVGGRTVAGRIDRVGKDQEGNFELIDFKTGAAEGKDPEELAKRAKRDDQLALYTIAAREALGINPKRVGLFYLDGGILVEVELTDAELSQRKAEIKKRIAQISKGEFAATPGMHCVWCPFSKICPFSQADRYR